MSRSENELRDVHCRNFGTSHVTALFWIRVINVRSLALNQILGGNRLKRHCEGGVGCDPFIRTSVNQEQEMSFHNDALASFVSCG